LKIYSPVPYSIDFKVPREMSVMIRVKSRPGSAKLRKEVKSLGWKFTEEISVYPLG
jgi:hypothetical protein